MRNYYSSLDTNGISNFFGRNDSSRDSNPMNHGPARCELAKKKEKKAVERIKKKKRKEGGKEIGSCRSVARLHYLRE